MKSFDQKLFFMFEEFNHGQVKSISEGFKMSPNCDQSVRSFQKDSIYTHTTRRKRNTLLTLPETSFLLFHLY
jgi:hypothetical protein